MYKRQPLYLYSQDKGWTETKLPEDIAANAPDVEGDTEQCWHYLIREFLKDIKGGYAMAYPTFDHGSRYQQIIDIIRKNDSWVDIRDMSAGR